MRNSVKRASKPALCGEQHIGPIRDISVEGKYASLRVSKASLTVGAHSNSHRRSLPGQFETKWIWGIEHRNDRPVGHVASDHTAQKPLSMDELTPALIQLFGSSRIISPA